MAGVREDEADLLFELSVRDAGEGQWRVEGRAPDEKGHERTAVDVVEALSGKQLADYRAKLQGAMSRPAALRGAVGLTPFRDGAGDQRIAQEFGGLLFRRLFQQQVFALYDASLQQATKPSRHRALKVRLFVELPALADVPWETLYNPGRRQHLCLDQNTPFARAGTLDTDAVEPVSTPLRILGMAPRITEFDNPLDNDTLGPVDADAEQARMQKALANQRYERLVQLSWTASGNLPDLEDRLHEPAGGAWHVFHFIGHGGFDPDRNGGEGEGFIIVQAEGETGGTRLYAQDLRNILQVPSGPQLVVLNCCSGAETKVGQLYASTAAELISGNIAAVIAMQFAISDDAAITFSSELYRWLGRGKPLPEAVTLTRMAMRRSGSPEWLTPVLYMRTRDGRLFQAQAVAGAEAGS